MKHLIFDKYDWYDAIENSGRLILERMEIKKKVFE